MFPPTLTHPLTLTATPLVFVCEALTPLRLDAPAYRAGSNLRGALGEVMRRAYCGHTPSPIVKASAGEGGAAHAAACPVCWLLAANERPGQERRGYVLRPPTDGRAEYEPGQRFEFGLTLLGETLRFLPYFVLAVPEMGRMGIGAGRGRFALKEVWAADVMAGSLKGAGERERLLAEGDSLVRTPTLKINSQRVAACAAALEERLESDAASHDGAGVRRITFRFLTPLRLIHDNHTVKAPDFGVFFARLLERLDDLEKQYGDSAWRRSLDEIQSLNALANQVRLIDSQTQWEDVWSGSRRTGRPTPIGGLVGQATYSAPAGVWRPLLPWLAWGQLVQVGKDVVKGNGVFEIKV